MKPRTANNGGRRPPAGATGRLCRAGGLEILAILLAAGWLAGCTFLRPTDPYAGVGRSGHPLTASGAAQPPCSTMNGPLTLAQAIAAALANNPEIAARRWDADAAQARRDQAFGARLPRLAIAGGYTHTLDAQRLLAAERDGQPGLFTQDFVSTDLVASLPLFTGGRLTRQAAAADLLWQAASQRLVRSREELVFRVSNVFFTILAQRHVVASLAFSRRSMAAHLDRMDALVAAGKAARVDRMRTAVRLADIEQQLVRERHLLTIHHRTLAGLLGWKDGDAEPSLAGELELPEPPPLIDLDTALARAWQMRGDYLAARSALEAEAKQVDAARSGHWPTLSVQGAYGGRWAAGPTAGAGDEQGDVGRVGLVVDVPLFSGGQVAASVRERRAELAAARERLRALDLQVRLEVETALLQVTAERERIAAVRRSVDEARESLHIEQRKYDLGKGAVVDVLDAQAALLHSQTTYYRALADLRTALAQLDFATGAAR